MSATRRWRVPLGLRFSLALAMVPLLALPPIGLRFLENPGPAARNLAASLPEHRALFDVEQATLRRRAGAELLPVELLADVVADDDAREWIETPGRAVPIRPVDPSSAPAGAASMHVRLAAARAQERPGRFFLLVDADDERLVLPQRVDGVDLPGDRLIVEYGDAPDAMRMREVTPRERPGGWLAEIEFDEEPRFLRVHLVDVDYLGSRRIEGRGDSGLLTPVQPLAEQALDPRSLLWADAVRGLARARRPCQSSGGGCSLPPCSCAPGASKSSPRPQPRRTRASSRRSAARSPDWLRSRPSASIPTADCRRGC